MTRRALFIILYLLSNSVGLSAQYYSLVIPSPDTSRVGFDICIDSKNAYVGIRTRCEPNAQSCTHIIKLDSLGNIRWRAKLGELDPANDNSIHVTDSTLYLSGYRTIYDSLSIYHRVLLNVGGSVLESKNNAIDSILRVFNYGSLILKNGDFIQYGGYQKDELFDGFVLVKSDSKGNMVSVKKFEFGNHIQNIWDMIELDNSNLIYLTDIDSPEDILSERSFKVDIIDTKNNNIRTLYDAGKITRQSGWSLDMISTGDGYVFTLPETENRQITEYRKIDLEGNVVWSREYQRALDPNFLDHRELYPCANGDILICGRYGVRAEELVINRSGIITRINADGDVLWQKQYTHQDPLTGEHRESTLMDILEDQQGNIVATGFVRNVYDGVRTSDTWILKVDADGCLGDTGDCGVLVTDVAELPELSSTMSIYPNPLQIGSSLTIANLPEGEHVVNIYGITGQQIASTTVSSKSNTMEIDVSSGLYIVSIPLLGVTTKLYIQE